MRLVIDTPGLWFEISRMAEPKTDDQGRQRTERADGQETGRPLWTVSLLARGQDDDEVIKVTGAGEQPRLARGQHVVVKRLEAVPWADSSSRARVSFPCRGRELLRRRRAHGERFSVPALKRRAMGRHFGSWLG